MQHLKTPVDLVSQSCLTPAIVQQALDTAYPYPSQGFIIWADDAPDVVTNPELSTFLWGKTVASVPNKEIYYYDGAAWELLPLVNGELLANNSIPLTKLQVTGATPFYIIQVNAGGDALIYVDIADAIQADSLNPDKLIAPDAINSYVLTCIAGVKSFQLISNFVAAIPAGTLPVSKLALGAANYFLRMNSGGTAAEWTTADIAAILAAGAVAGQSIRRNSGNTGWEFFTPVSSLNSYALYEERQTAGVAGGAFTSGDWRTRALNTEVVDTDGIGSLSGNEVILAAGDYRFKAIAVTFRVGASRLRLYNSTAAAAILTSYGMSSGVDEIGADNGNIVEEASGEFTLNTQSNLQLQHYCSTSNGTNGFGVAANIDSIPEIYSRLEIWKLS